MFGHSHNAHHHDHSHGAFDAALWTAEKGIWAVKWSMIGLLLTALLQAVVVAITSSMALLADTLHNLGDAATSIPLWIAFLMARRKPDKRFTYGYGRVEDLAGIVIVLLMLATAATATYASISRLLHPQDIQHLGAVVVASLIGFAGNELVARLRIRVGREIGSAALVADGYHARTDGWTSLGVLLGAGGVGLGYQQADPLVGLVISLVIFKIVWDSGRALFLRLLDGVDPEVIEEVSHAARHVPAVLEVTDVRVRWIGHRLLADVNITVKSDLSVEAGHQVAHDVRHQLLHHLRYLSNATIHVDPEGASGEEHHHIHNHQHDELPSHSH